MNRAKVTIDPIAKRLVNKAWLPELRHSCATGSIPKGEDMEHVNPIDGWKWVTVRQDLRGDD